MRGGGRSESDGSIPRLAWEEETFLPPPPFARRSAGCEPIRTGEAALLPVRPWWLRFSRPWLRPSPWPWRSGTGPLSPPWGACSCSPRSRLRCCDRATTRPARIQLGRADVGCRTLKPGYPIPAAILAPCNHGGRTGNYLPGAFRRGYNTVPLPLVERRARVARAGDREAHRRLRADAIRAGVALKGAAELRRQGPQ